MSDIPISVQMTVAESDAAYSMSVEDQIVVNPAPPWDWMGKNAELVKTFPLFTVALKDTEFNTWTPSNTAKEILATASFGTFDADLENYDYTIKWTFDTNLVMASGATLNATVKRQLVHLYQQPFRRPSNYDNFISKTDNITASGPSIPANNVGVIEYYNSNGVLTTAFTTFYGFYATIQAMTFSSAYVTNPTITLARPALSARCSNTYFSTARAAELDKNNSTLTLKCEVYRSAKPNFTQAAYDTIINEYWEE